jgi:hypothetical protein
MCQEFKKLETPAFILFMRKVKNKNFTSRLEDAV